MNDCVLITGGAGFIGTNFVRHWLANAGGRTINLDKLTYAGSMSSLADLEGNDRHEFVRGDIGDRPLLRSLLKKYRPWAVVNFAAESHVDRSIDSPGEFIQTNIVGVYALLEEAREYWRELDAAERMKFRFLHVSTDEVYGSLNDRDPAFSECSPYRPSSPYAASKAASDHLLRAYHHTYGLPTLTTNCSNNYGPYQFPEKLIPLMILTALERRPLPVYGDGANVRDWLFVEDHCDAIHKILCAGRVGETYNIGGESEQTNLQVVESICAVMDDLVPSRDGEPYSRLISFVPDRPGHDRRYAIDPGKVQREFGWHPKESFVTGLTKTVRWYLANPGWCHSVGASYAGQRLGLAGA